MIRSPPIPLAIGTDFQRQVGRTEFRKTQRFGIQDNVRMLVEGKCPSGSKGPEMYSASLQPPGEMVSVPSWVAFDKETLTFLAYFQEALEQHPGSTFLPRFVKIHYFLEDGTILVVEPRTNNSGLTQGVLIGRQRIRVPAAASSDEFISVADLNVGREVELYGRVFMVYDCDHYTRNFLNRNGVSVPDPIKPPADPYLAKRKQDKRTELPRKPKKPSPDITQFLKYDGCVLRFYGYWDDRENGGDLHRIILLYYLADDTIEIREESHEKGTRPTHLFLSRQKLPMEMKVTGPGRSDGIAILNVLMEDNMGPRYLLDSLNCGAEPERIYRANDLALGCVVNVMGRPVVLCDCDKYTQEFYRKNYGLDSFEPLPYPDDAENECKAEIKEPPPPYNGFGSYEDSLANCLRIIPKRTPGVNLRQFLRESTDGFDSHVLRFKAKMITANNRTAHREFLICCYMVDDTISVTESVNDPEKGNKRVKFFRRYNFLKPGENKYGSKKPAVYTSQDLYVGATIILNEFTFYLYEADDYTMRYMELNSNRFPKSNIIQIMEKIRNAARPVYRQWASEAFGPESERGSLPIHNFRKALKELGIEDLSEHEIMTAARKFRIRVEKTVDPWRVRQSISCLFKREIYVIDKMGLMKYFQHFDADHTGRLPMNIILNCLKASKIPMAEAHYEYLPHCFTPAEDGGVPYQDVIDFLDFFSTVPCMPDPPSEWLADERLLVEANEFLRELGIEEESAQQEMLQQECPKRG